MDGCGYARATGPASCSSRVERGSPPATDYMKGGMKKMENRLLSRCWVIAALTVMMLLLPGVVSRVCSAELDLRFQGSQFAVSPDGKLAYPVPAYDDTGDPATQFWVSNLDGSDRKLVGTLPEIWDVRCVGSRQLAAVRFDTDRVYFLPMDGGKPKVFSLTNSYHWTQPEPSPDGKWIAFPAVQREPRKSGLFLLNTTTGKIITLNNDVIKSYVRWSPDSKKLVYGEGSYQKDYKLKIVSIPGGKITDLGTNGVGATWSPDGKWIAYTGNIVRGGSWYGGIPIDGNILKINPVTKETVALTDPPVNVNDDSTGTWEVGGDINPVWSPDGKKIVYRHKHELMNAKDYATKQSDDQIWVMNSDGSGKRKVFDKWGSYAWSPDNESIFVKDKTSITRVSLDSGTGSEVVAWTIPERPEIKESDWKTIKGKTASIKYARMDSAYPKAILAVTQAARDIYANTFHCDMPAFVEVEVKKDSYANTNLWTDGNSRFFLTVRSMDDLLPPMRSGYFNIYGICHELGHIAMYRRIRMLGLPPGVGEGWAHFAGSVVTDEVYKRLGKNVWPVPYDYREDGMARLQKTSENPDAQKDATTRVAVIFLKADEKYGAPVVFKAMNDATADKPYGKDFMPRFADALAQDTSDPSAKSIIPEDLLVTKVDWQVKDREINDQTTEGEMTENDSTGIILKYDDGSSEGKWSTAGSGHAVVFKRPAGNWAVDAVMMYGARYGDTEPPRDNFYIFVCDQDFSVLKEIDEPYSKLELEQENGQGDKWYRFDFDPVTVPEGFYVCIFFDPTATKGFYMHYDKDVKKVHSRAALPWSFVRDLPNGQSFDWMIRAHLRKMGD